MSARPAAIAFRDAVLITHYVTMHANVMRVIVWAATYVWPRHGQRFLTITAGWYEGGSGVHADYRAVDVSARDWRTGELLQYDRARAIEAEINAAWDHGSDGRYPVCLYHVAEWGENREWHFHLQVRDGTELREAPRVDD